MIEEFPARLLQSSSRSQPVVIATQRSVIGCGCSAYVGTRVDRGEGCTVLRACSKGHEPLVEAVQNALVESLKTPRDTPLVEFLDELMIAAEKQLA